MKPHKVPHRQCCNCGMVHGPGNCVRVEHFISMLVNLQNHFDELKRRLKSSALKRRRLSGGGR